MTVQTDERRPPPRLTGRLPTPRGVLVGRAEQVSDIVSRLTMARLVTLTGTGGTGKTRLAIAAATSMASMVRHGVCWVELGALRSPELVADAVASALGASPARERGVLQAVADSVGPRDILLALDNCEHLADASAELVDFLLDACPYLRVLATSREALAVEGELVWPVPPLALPPARGKDLAPLVTGSAACQLFEQRSRAVVPDFTVTADNATVVARLCRRLEGLPLAIELAAARMRVMSVAQIDAGLGDVFHLLVGGARTAPARQQTLRATLDWSHRLLTEHEEALFRRLAIFPGAFDLVAAESVAAQPPLAKDDILDLLTRLVDRSLVHVRRTGDHVRYRLLATVRPYAREKLSAAGELAMTSRAHLRYFADLVTSTEPKLEGRDQSRELDRLEIEGNNLRVALSYGRDAGELADGMRLAAFLWRLCYLRGHYREGREWLDWAATVDPHGPADIRAKALHGGGALAFLECDYSAAVRRLEGSLELYRELGDPIGSAMALQALGSVSREQGRYARAVELHTEALELFEGAGRHLGVAQARGYLGFAAWLQGDWLEARTLCEQALAEFQALGDSEGIAWSLISLGTVAQYEGRLEDATTMLSEAHRISDLAQYPEGIAWAVHEQGLVAMRRGDPQAEALLLDSLRRHRQLGDRWRTASVLEDLAASVSHLGRAEQAAALLGAADAIRTQIGTELAPCERSDHERVEARVRSWLGGDGLAANWNRGRETLLDDLLAAQQSTAVHHSTTQPQDVEHRTGEADHEAGDVAACLTVRALGLGTAHLDERLLEAADWGYAKPRELLFLLVGAPPQTKEQIGSALWPALSGRQLRNAFHTALRDLRRALGDPGWVLFSAGRYSLNTTRPHVFDVETFETALADARRARPAAAAMPHLQRAIAAYQGDFVPDLADAEWTQARRDGLRRGFGSALVATGRLLAAEGRYREAAGVFRRAVAHEPLDETSHRQLMSALIRAGEVGQAASVYHQLTERLRVELGVAPAAETTALYRQLIGPR